MTLLSTVLNNIDQLVVANSRERDYFEKQILALLLVHETLNLLRIKFAHISPQVEGLCYNKMRYAV